MLIWAIDVAVNSSPIHQANMYVAFRGARHGPCLGAFVLFQPENFPVLSKWWTLYFYPCFSSQSLSYWSFFSFLLKFSNSLFQHFRIWSFGCLPNQMVAQHLTQLCRYFAPPLPVVFFPLLSYPLLLSFLLLLFVMFGRDILISSMLSSSLYCCKCVCFRFCSFLNEPYGFCLLSLNRATVTVRTIITWNRIPSCIPERLESRCLTPVQWITSHTLLLLFKKKKRKKYCALGQSHNFLKWSKEWLPVWRDGTHL